MAIFREVSCHHAFIPASSTVWISSCWIWPVLVDLKMSVYLMLACHWECIMGFPFMHDSTQIYIYLSIYLGQSANLLKRLNRVTHLNKTWLKSKLKITFKLVLRQSLHLKWF